MVRTTIYGEDREVRADRWDDFTGAVGYEWPTQPAVPAERFTVLAGEYTAIDEASFEKACAAGTRL